MIQMTGAKTGLLVTEGFRDEIEMRRCFKEDIWDPALQAPAPIARRRVRLEVPGRLTRRGRDRRPARRGGRAKAAVRRLRAFGVTSIAVSFLHSYINPVHELRARDIVLEEYPDVELISLSHEVFPKPPEFERTSTTLVNAYVGPPIARYLGRLEATLRSAGLRRRAAHRHLLPGASPPLRRFAAGPWPRSARARPAAPWRQPRRPPAPDWVTWSPSTWAAPPMTCA